MKLLEFLFKTFVLFSSFFMKYTFFDAKIPYFYFFLRVFKWKFCLSASRKNYCLFLGLIPLCLNLSLSAEEVPVEKNMQMNTRITTDHHFRGYNYSMLASQRNNTEYASTNFAPAFQPSFTYSAPLKGIKTFFWGNFFLKLLQRHRKA